MTNEQTKKMIEDIARWMGLEPEPRLGNNGWLWGTLQEGGALTALITKNGNGTFNPLGIEVERGEGETYTVTDYEDMVALEDFIASRYKLTIISDVFHVTVRANVHLKHETVAEISLPVEDPTLIRKTKTRALCELALHLIKLEGR